MALPSYRKGVRSTACTVAPRTGGALARTFFASMTDKVRSAHTPMRTLSILLPSVIMAAIRLSGPTSLCPPCFLAYADRAVQLYVLLSCPQPPTLYANKPVIPYRYFNATAYYPYFSSFTTSASSSDAISFHFSQLRPVSPCSVHSVFR